MGAAKERGVVVWAVGVPALAVVALVVGLLTPARPRVASVRSDGEAGSDSAELMSDPNGAGRPELAGIRALDPQPELFVQHVVIELSQPFDSPEAAALLTRAGGADPTLQGVWPVDPELDVSGVQRAVRGVPTASVKSVMGVIVYGGQAAGVGVEAETTDPTTGVVTGRRSVMVSATVTALEGGKLRVAAALASEHDSNMLEVLGRRAGVDLGESLESDVSIVLEDGQNAVIRLPGPTLRLVFVSPRVSAGLPAPGGEGGQ